jgi:hypothetical protein
MKTIKMTNDFIERCIQLIVHMVIANKKEWFMKAKMKKKGMETPHSSRRRKSTTSRINFIFYVESRYVVLLRGTQFTMLKMATGSKLFNPKVES